LGHEKVRKEENGRRRNERIMQCLPDILWKTSAKSSGFAAKMRRSSQTGPRPAASPGIHIIRCNARSIRGASRQSGLTSNRQLK
jgi:hypothetical protein